MLLRIPCFNGARLAEAGMAAAPRKVPATTRRKLQWSPACGSRDGSSPTLAPLRPWSPWLQWSPACGSRDGRIPRTFPVRHFHRFNGARLAEAGMEGFVTVVTALFSAPLQWSPACGSRDGAAVADRFGIIGEQALQWSPACGSRDGISKRALPDTNSEISASMEPGLRKPGWACVGSCRRPGPIDRFNGARLAEAGMGRAS